MAVAVFSSVAIRELEADRLHQVDKDFGLSAVAPHKTEAARCQRTSNHCSDCLSKFLSSGVVEAVKEVKWEFLHSSTYDLLKTVSSVCKHALSVHTKPIASHYHQSCGHTLLCKCLSAVH